jgi:hypothetical protein
MVFLPPPPDDKELLKQASYYLMIEIVLPNPKPRNTNRNTSSVKRQQLL